MTVSLRVATLDDLGAIMALENASFGSDAWATESMRGELASTHTHYLVAIDDDPSADLAGYAGLLSPRRSRDAEIQTIAVAPAARRHGLGRMLMLALLDTAVARGASQVFLEVRADNPTARALYDSLGFEEIAVRPHYYQPDGVDAQVMKKVLP